MKDIAIQFRSERLMFDILEKRNIKFIQSDSEPTVCEATVTDEQERELLALKSVIYLSEL